MPSGAYNRIKYNLLRGLIDLSENSAADIINVALLDSNHSFDPDNNVWGDVSANEISGGSGTGYTTGGQVLNNQSVTQDDTNDLAKYDADDAEWTEATFTVRHAVLYDTSVSDTLIISIDFGEDKQVSNGTFTIQWSTDGILRLT